MGYFFLVAAWLLPNHYPPWVNFHSEFLAFVGLALLCFAHIKRLNATLAIPQISLAVLLLAAIPCPQYMADHVFFAGDAFISTFYVISFAVAIALGYLQCRQNNGNTGVGWLGPSHVLLVAALTSAFLAVLQWLSLTESFAIFVTPTDIGDRAMANLGQPNQLGTLLLMGLLALALLFELRKISLLLLVIGGAFLTWAIVLTESRTAMLGALVMAGFLFYKIWARRLLGAPLRLQNTHVLFWLALFCTAALSLPVVNSALLLEGDRQIELLNNNGRVAIWLQTLHAVYESPWVGYGWNQTPVAQAVGALHSPGDLAFTNAHNIFLDLCAWVGLPLGLLIAMGFGYWFYSRARLVHSTGAIYAMAMLLPFLVHSMLEFPFAYAYFLLMAGLLMGVVESDFVTNRRFLVPRPVAAVGLAVMIVVGGYAAYEYLLIEEDYRVARFENLKVGRTPDDHVRPDIVVHTQLAAMLAALRQPAVPNMTSEQVERLRKVSLRFGARSMVYRYAVALGLNGQPAAATRQMQVFRGMFGERAYQMFKFQLRELQAEKYPELAAVLLP